MPKMQKRSGRGVLNLSDFILVYCNMFSAPEKNYILNLARRSIGYYFKTDKVLEVDAGELPSEQLKEKRACFVTLTIAGNLRGCIGHVEPVQPLYLDVIDNAVSAAFNDARFYPLKEEEFNKVDIEVSLLSVPQLLQFASADELLSKLRPNIDGVILRQGNYGATYLPQVWEQLPDKEQFLSSLCTKAGLSPNAWQRSNIEVMVYKVEIIK